MTKATLTPLDYPSTLQVYYEKFVHLPGFVLLESSDKQRGRYDILSAYPYDKITIYPDELDLKQSVNAIKARLVVEESNYDLPFQGGAIGYISYDFGARLAGIFTNSHAELQPVPLLSLGLYDWAIIVDHHLQKTVLFAAHTQSLTRDIIAEARSIWQQMPSYRYFAQIEHEVCSIMSKKVYQNAFAQVQYALQTGRSYQVNLTQAFKIVYTGDSWAFYRAISSTNRVPFSAFLRFDSGDILSFSPERLLRYNRGKLLTSPIKGTSKRSHDVIEDEALKHQLSLSEKNKAENVMIVDLLRNDLAKIATPGSVKVNSLCAVESYHSVHHLVSTIEAVMEDGLHPFDAFLACFPGGSITGAPKLEAMRVIDEAESYSRGIYCGSIGFFSRHGYFDTNIAIRTITAINQTLHFAAGGGIVMDSQCEEEYQECFIKIAAILNGLKKN